ncbi:FMN-dependent NADH-azoreductase [Dickeya zeae]|uniref:FMN-dependent NADH-azoreductase n=1 Tax=Dickeya zeae TaxID=204042 RepID=UPI0003C7E4E7|nr:NAD(P)H-dependent oxidoreductase [Dickeya zeae]MCA6987928.1 NAD(P)H-dependent oxidoreductase [Dickeya zeae]
MKLLHIDSSLHIDDSVSKTLSAHIVTTLQSRYTPVQVTRLDLAVSPLDHLTQRHLDIAQERTISDGMKADLAAGITALEDFLAADIVVIGAPMYNFGISSQLKAWIDRITVAGKTFQYGNGPTGLCHGKKVIIASSRGGIFSEGSPIAFLDHQETYLKALFGFLGISDITFIRAEGVAMGVDGRSTALTQAEKEIAMLNV